MLFMRSVLLTLCVCAFCLNVTAAVSEKKFEKKLPKEEITELTISNKFGRIVVEQTDDYEISVEVNMSVTAKSGAKADEILELISIREAKGSSYLIETNIAKDMTIQQLVNGVTLDIDYTISVPKGIKLRLINSDGGVYLTDFEGELNVDLKNGDFKASTIKSQEAFYVKQEKGNFDIEDVNFLSGDFKSCMLNIEEGGDVRLVTSSCDGNLSSIEKLSLRTTGGTMKLGEIEDLSGTSSTTKFEVQDIGNLLNMDMRWGEMNVRNIHFNFSEINLKGSFTKVGLTFMEGAGYNLELKHNKSLKMDLPASMKLEDRPTAEKNMILGTTFFGDPKYKGKVILSLSNGNLYIQ